MKKLVSTLIIIFVVILGIVVAGPFFIVNEGEQTVVVRLGQIVQVSTDPGLHYKVPFIDQVYRYPRRIMAWVGQATEMPSRERQFIFVDVIARWRIADPRTFYERILTVDVAHERLSEIINGRVRDIVGENLLLEMVRNSDHIIESTASANMLEGVDLGDGLDTSILAMMIQPESQNEPIIFGRQQLAQEMLNRARQSVPGFGIELIDVVIRQVRYTEQLTQSVYERMAIERSQLAQGIRSVGLGEKERLEGRTEQERREILSAAYEEAETVRGIADAEAARIYADAYNRNQSFFSFWRAIESYRTTMPDMNATLSTDMDYFRYVFSPN